MVQAPWSCLSGSRLAQGNVLVSSGLGSRQWRFLPDQSADPRVCGWGEEVLMLRRCLHLTVQSADCTTLCRAGWDLGGLFCNGAVRTLSLVQIHKVSGTLKGQTWDPWGDKDADRLPSQVPAVKRMVPCDTAILYVSSQEWSHWKELSSVHAGTYLFSVQTIPGLPCDMKRPNGLIMERGTSLVSVKGWDRINALITDILLSVAIRLF